MQSTRLVPRVPRAPRAASRVRCQAPQGEGRRALDRFRAGEAARRDELKRVMDRLSDTEVAHGKRALQDLLAAHSQLAEEAVDGLRGREEPAEAAVDAAPAPEPPQPDGGAIQFTLVEPDWVPRGRGELRRGVRLSFFREL